MATTTLEPVKALFTSAIIDKLSPILGEKPDNIHKALNLLIPAVIASVTSRAGENGLNTLYNSAKSLPPTNGLNLHYLVEHEEDRLDVRRKVAEQGRHFLETLVGPPISELVNTTTGLTGLRFASAASLMGFVGSGLLGFLHNQIEKGQLTKTQLGELLQAENEHIIKQVPGELNRAVPDLIIKPDADLKTKNSSKPPQPVKMQLSRKEFDTMFLRMIVLILLVVMLLDTVQTCTTTKEKKAEDAQQTTFLNRSVNNL